MKSEFAYSPSTKGFTKQVQSWMPVSLLNTFICRLQRQRGKYDWRAKIMKREIDYRLMECKGEIMRDTK